MNPFVLNLASKKWSNAGACGDGFSFKGHAYLSNRSSTPQGVAAYFAAAIEAKKLTAALQQVNGFYSWILQRGNCIFAGVDHVRSFPIFYAQVGDSFFLSDDAEWVRKQVGDVERDVLAKEEFLLSGYVTGQDTLYKNVKQLQAGELIEARYINGAFKIQCVRYYKFSHVEPRVYTEDELKARLHQVTCNSMRRLIEYAEGRQIVVPLSGGYDSRLIVSVLKNLGYTNVLCFTYGVPGNKEAEYSCRIAKALNFKWEFVEYSAALWRDEWSTPAASAYKSMAANHVSLPHVQDWLAIRHLTRIKAINSDAVVAPGHSGDFVAGSHIPEFVFLKKRHSKNSLLQALIKNHLSNVPNKNMSLLKNRQLADRLKSRIDEDFDGTDAAVANLYEMWDWQERQAKYIVNSVRVYDQFGLDWWLPQWDLEFLCFWAGVPLILRRRRLWFKKWIQEQYSSAIGETIETSELNNASDRSALHDVFVKIARILPPPLMGLAKRVRRRRIYKSHFLAFEGLVEPHEFDEYLKKEYSIVGMYSDLYLKNKW